jgi:vesicle-associated membrane protein 7
MARGISDSTAFSFLNDLKKRFLKSFEMKTIKSSFAFGLREFNEEIRSLIKFYEDNPTHSKTDVLLNNLNETASVLRESVEKLLERHEKLNIIAHKSKNLKNTSEDLVSLV